MRNECNHERQRKLLADESEANRQEPTAAG